MVMFDDATGMGGGGGDVEGVYEVEMGLIGRLV